VSLVTTEDAAIYADTSNAYAHIKYRSQMRNPELPIATGVAALLILVALPAKFRVRNIALLALIVNCFFINLLSCINTLVWADHARDIAPVWCDISTCLVLACLSC